MKRVAAVATLMIACGGNAPPPTTNPVAPPPPAAGSGSAAPAGPRELTTDETCARFTALAEAHCANFHKLVPPPDQCDEMMTRVLADAQGHQIAECAVNNQECDKVMACIQDVASAPAKREDLRACGTQGSGPVGVTPAEYAQRNGAATKELAKVTSSKAKPVETCGFDEERLWIDAATCADGSTPARGKAEAVRAGNVGVGGTCGSIIDLYKVPCPERTYDVFVDAYVCPK